MAQTQLESTKLLCESLHSTKEETELKLIKADLEKMKDQFEKIHQWFKQHFILMDAKFNLLMTGVFDQVGEKLDMLIKNVDKDDK